MNVSMVGTIRADDIALALYYDVTNTLGGGRDEGASLAGKCS